MNRKQDRSRWTGILGHDAEITGHVGPKYAAYTDLIHKLGGKAMDGMYAAIKSPFLDCAQLGYSEKPYLANSRLSYADLFNLVTTLTKNSQGSHLNIY